MYWFWVPAITSMVFWPWVVMLLRYYQRRFRIY
jgi:cell shape-determining protein MreD